MRRLAILGFHKIGPSPEGQAPTWFYIPEETFVAQLRHLREDSWQVIDVAALLRGLESPATLPERAALLTFDDGYRSILDVALRWLTRFGYPATVFVPTDFIGGRNAFDEAFEPSEAICDWDDLRALQRCGISIQSHGASHRRLSTLSPADREAELSRSKAVLEHRLDTRIDVFAYPYGDAGAEPQSMRGALEQSGYRAACLYGGGPVRVPVVDPFRLARVAMGPDTDLAAVLAPPAGSQRSGGRSPAPTEPAP